jgi:cytosine/adenosine deaminase-related metal-dependent hydrolase
MKYGDLTEDEALRTCTINAAKELGLDQTIGSLETGKDADVLIWTGHPLSTYSRVETTFIEGEIYFDRTRDLDSRKQLVREKRERLQHERDEEAKQKKEEPKKDADEDRPEPTEGGDHA